MTETTDKALALASHYLEVDRPQRALDTLAKLTGEQVEDVAFWELRAHALLGLERHAQAVDAAKQGLRLEGESIVLLDLLCLAEAERGNLAEAERAILQALKLEPEEPLLLCHYAQLLGQGAQLDKAERVVAEAERLDPDSPDAIRTRMFLAYLRGDDRKAEKLSKRLLEEDPENPAGHAMLGVFSSNKGAYRRASKHYDIAARYDLSDEYAVGLARQGRIEAHPLYWPLAPFQRWGPAKVWIAAIALFGLLVALEQYKALIVAWVVYTALCVYSWVAPPLLNWWFGRRYA